MSKMTKKILSIFLLTFLVVSFAVPAYANSEEANSIEIPQTDPQVQAVNEAIERLDLSAADISEEAVIEALEAEGIGARADIFAYVYDFAGLEAALADPAVSIILLLADIQMDYTLTIDRDISMSGVLGSTLTAVQSEVRHFHINSRNNISLVFSNVILDGGGIGGGISLGAPVYINGLILQNCYGRFAAITTITSIATRAVSENENAQIQNEYAETDNFSTDVTLEDCIVRDNVGSMGGGVLSGSITVVNCEISGNSASVGGGMHLGGRSYIKDSQIMNNTAEAGGGIYLIANGFPVYDFDLEGTQISFNSAEKGGGVYAHMLTQYTYSISGGTYEGNTADFGGALYFQITTGWETNHTELSDMVVKNNYARTGGGMHITLEQLPHITISESVSFSENTADDGYYMTDPEDIALYKAHVFATHFSEPFIQYALNNFDISYTKGDVLKPVTVNLYQRYSDTEPYEIALVYAGQPLDGKLPAGPEQSGLKFIGWVDINGVSYGADTVITEDIKLYPAYILD